MCGIAGVTSPGGDKFVEMVNALDHRGPDRLGIMETDSGLCLGHRRLTVVDVSESGAQPMSSSDGRWVITFNGEIYGYRQLRHELEQRGVRFRGTSDTEVLVELIASSGVLQALKTVKGMFAFGLVDRREKRLFLARDRMGEKPLYYGMVGGDFVFGSELKAIFRHPAFLPQVNRSALISFFRYGFIPAPVTIFEGIAKLPAGHICEVDLTRPANHSVTPYWTIPSVTEPWLGSPEEAVDKLEELLVSSVDAQSVADVPVGALLSGGIDSSTVVALMVQAGSDVSTFTIGFSEPAFDEADHARAVARHLGTDHTELEVTPKQAMDVIPLIPSVYDEPFGDQSQIPTYLVSELARSKVTVALSGDGGDELFGGYDRYDRLETVMRAISRVPQRLTPLLDRTFATVPDRAWDRLLALLWMIRRGNPSIRPTSETITKLRQVISSSGAAAEVHELLMTRWLDTTGLVLDGSPPDQVFVRSWAGESLRAGATHADALVYLPDDLLVKVDRASMAHSLEVRAPLLDHELVEWVWSLPSELRFGGDKPKSLMREVLYRHVPPELVDRPKKGFGVPVGEWVRGSMRPWAEGLLAEERLRESGFINPLVARGVWEDHLSGRRDHSARLWLLLMFQAWWETWMA